MTFLVLLILVAAVGLQPAAAQRADDRKGADEILAAFTKRKHKVKERSGARVEMFKEVRPATAERPDPADYSGRYVEGNVGSALTLRVDPDGRVEASGSERGAAGAPERRFAIEGAAIRGALLTGTKVYGDGASEPFEGLFVELTTEEGTSPERITHRSTRFGLASVGEPREIVSGFWTDKFFYERMQPAP